LDEMNKGFREALFAKEGANGGGGGTTRTDEGVVKRAPMTQEKWIPKFSIEKLRGVVAGVPAVSPGWFMERSPVDVAKIGPGDFLNATFDPGERVLVFSSFFSQGEYLWEAGKGGYRLAERRGVKAVPSK